MRQYIPMSTFGYYAGGMMDVRLSDFRSEKDLDNKMVTTVSDCFELQFDFTNQFFLTVWIFTR